MSEQGAMMSAEVNEIAAALGKAQAVMHVARRDGRNPHFSSQYSTLAEVWEVIREPLTKNGLSVTQLPAVEMAPTSSAEEMTRGVVRCSTMVMHTSGQWLKSEITLPLRGEFLKSGKEIPPGPHQIGSAITYARRYGLCAMLGVASEEDDDGNKAAFTGGASVEAKAEVEIKPNRRSVYTGKSLDTREAIAEHKAAAEASKGQDAAQPGGNSGVHTAAGAGLPLDKAMAGGCVKGVANVKLARVMLEDGITIDKLDGYLRGEIGVPRMKQPILIGGMTLNSLGEKIVNALLKPETWKMIKERIAADRDCPPF